MTQFNPLTGSILQSTQVARQQAASKAAHVRRAQQLSKNVAARDDEMEHQVESSDQVSPAKDEGGRQGGKRKQKRGDDKPHIDLTA
jgi:hypothetical protein